MKQVKLEAAANGNRVIAECDDYMTLMNEAVELQKTETSSCTDTYSEALTGADESTNKEADDLHARADDVGGNLKKCQELEVVAGVNCLSSTSDEQIKILSKLTSDSNKLSNKHLRSVQVAENDYNYCKTDVTYFYSDVINEIMSLHRDCVLSGEKVDYEIPEYKST